MSSPEHAPGIPRATYRLQFNKDFGFDDAAVLAPYLAALGVSHVYASPYLRARPGSTHGYDIVSHTELNPELGTAEAYARMVAAFKAHGLSQILDFVPNHMGVGGADNPWWLNVLEWGPDSEFAGWFDIDWETDRLYLRQKILVPFLGDHYGAVLASGGLKLKFDADEGSFAVWAYDTHKLPICPLHYGRILGDKHAELERLSDAFAHLSAFRPHVQRCADELKAELAEHARNDPKLAAAIETALDRFNGASGNLETWARLDELIGDQYWRAAHFRVAADDINYRRFFNINDLAGIRIELPELFDHAHSLIFQLLEDGVLDGLRLDHIDGLLDPKAYCLRLRDKAPRLPYLVVEKILAPHESLRADWNVDGTTGYEFANLVTRLMIDPAGEEVLTRFYAEFTGQDTPFSEIARDCKLRIMENEMASELNVLARDAGRVARSNARTADFTDNVLRRALQQIIACFPVYRTYVDGSAPSDADRRDIDWALAHARRYDTALDPSVFDFLYGLLTCDLIAEPRSGFSRVAVIRVAMRAQQYSGPVMAKGVEDTAFYRYNRLLALNEVGGQPDQFSTSPTAFHYANAERAKRTPHAMLSTSTHDTKRGEDARARLAVLSECAEAWTQRVGAWSRILRAGSSGSPQDTPPDRNDEYAFYQLLLGSWPMELSTGAVPDAPALDLFRQRIEGAMVKAMREAKVHTTWAAPNAAYEDAVLDFIRHALDVSRTNPFLESFVAFQARMAWFGMHNSLVQTVLKLTAPGVPDIYQGAELWDLSLVDPDNRRPVDFAARQKMLACGAKHARDALQIKTFLETWQDGGLKLSLIEAVLQARAALPDLFRGSSYIALNPSGPGAGRICAFARQSGDTWLVVAVALCPSADQAWTDTDIALPAGFESGDWRNILDGSIVCATNASFAASALFATLPVAVLTTQLT
ncbi:malto-oligosyltrehalose synthase [Methyloferula stellata]|uniref:malto-oligosyltrehalose synthase n=1 Tax=Methyloferula stellata TaxID=876270 RepID=UPI00036C80C6|nr:malto-oligosyltrehalose synthase [Methyloferula stellata]